MGIPEVQEVKGCFYCRYVVKAVVYEIGILTDSSDEDNSTDFERYFLAIHWVNIK